MQVQRKQVGLSTLHAKLSEYIDKIDTDLVSTQHVGMECNGMEDVSSLWGAKHVGCRPMGCSGSEKEMRLYVQQSRMSWRGEGWVLGKLQTCAGSPGAKL